MQDNLEVLQEKLAHATRPQEEGVAGREIKALRVWVDVLAVQLTF